MHEQLVQTRCKPAPAVRRCRDAAGTGFEEAATFSGISQRFARDKAIDSQGNYPNPQPLISIQFTYFCSAEFTECTGAFKLCSKWGEVGENRPQSSRFGLFSA